MRPCITTLAIIKPLSCAIYRQSKSVPDFYRCTDICSFAFYQRRHTFLYTHTHQIYILPFLPLANDFHTNVHNISVLFIFIYLILPFFSIFQPKLLHHKSCPLAAIKYPIIYPQSICTLMDNGNGRGRYPRNWFFANVYVHEVAHMYVCS